MKTWFTGLMLAVFALTLWPADSEAKRLGGSKSYGMQRNTPDKPAQGTPATPAATPNTAAAPAAAAAPGAAAAAAPKRSWMGPIAGLAAGLGLAALLGHLGLGAEFANFLMFALLAVVAVVAIRWAMRRFAGGSAPGRGLATAGAGAGAIAGGFGTAGRPDAEASTILRRDSVAPASAAPAWNAGVNPSAAAEPSASSAPVLPAGFDAAAFERIAKMIFIRLQAANDSADLNDLRSFTTPELFAALRLDLQERGAVKQQTDVVTVQAEVLECAQEDGRQIVSVRFHGLMREEADTEACAFDEVWHLVKPLDDSRAWAIAGIQQHA